jgi:hypothetical protein
MKEATNIMHKFMMFQYSIHSGTSYMIDVCHLITESLSVICIEGFIHHIFLELRKYRNSVVTVVYTVYGLHTLFLYHTLGRQFLSPYLNLVLNMGSREG